MDRVQGLSAVAAACVVALAQSSSRIASWGPFVQHASSDIVVCLLVCVCVCVQAWPAATASPACAT